MFARFLTIALVSIPLLATSVRAADAPKEKKKKKEWEVLFDGKSVESFRGYKHQDFPNESWKVENGVLKTNPKGKPIDLVTKKKYDNFELRLEWKVTPGANGGVMYHVNEDYEEAWWTGPEMQVLDDDKHPDGKTPKTTAGALYALIAPNKKKQLKPVGEWNKVRLIVRGYHVEHRLNGKKIVEYELGSPELQELIKKSKFADKPQFAKLPTGFICLQHHKDEVWYQDIKIRPLDPNEKGE